MTACIQSVTMFGAELWWQGDKTVGTIGWANELQLLANQQGRAVTGCFRTTNLGVLSMESGLRPAAGQLENRQRRFALRLLSLPQGDRAREVVGDPTATGGDSRQPSTRGGGARCRRRVGRRGGASVVSPRALVYDIGRRGVGDGLRLSLCFSFVLSFVAFFGTLSLFLGSGQGGGQRSLQRAAERGLRTGTGVMNKQKKKTHRLCANAANPSIPAYGSAQPHFYGGIGNTIATTSRECFRSVGTIAS